MTPKEKAEDLYEKFYKFYPKQDAEFIAIECSLIAVDEIEKEIYTYYERFKYWQQVKQEIKKL